MKANLVGGVKTHGSGKKDLKEWPAEPPEAPRTSQKSKAAQSVSHKSVVFQDIPKYISGKAMTAIQLTGLLTRWGSSVFR